MYRPYTSPLGDSRPFRDVESQLRDLTQDFAMSFNTGNYDQAAGLFATDGELMARTMKARTDKSRGAIAAPVGRVGVR